MMRDKKRLVIIESDIYFHIFANMINKKHYYLATLVLLMVSCVHYSDVHNRLNEAERLMKDNPDSARYLLEQIDSAHLGSFKTSARYSLLHTMAIDRSGIDTTDYSLICPASVFYLKRGRIEDRAKMLFYYGRICFNNNDYDSSLKHYLAALHLAEKTNNNWLKGMICASIAIVYNKNHNASEELSYQLRSYDHFVLNGDEKYTDNARYLLALAFHNNNRIFESDSLYSLIAQGTPFYPLALLGLANNEMFKDSLDASRAVDFFNKAQKGGAPFSIDQYYQYAYALLLNGQKEKSKSLLARLSALPDDTKSLWWKYLLSKDEGDKDMALSLLEVYEKERTKFINLKQAQSAYKSVSEYYSDISHQAEERATRIKLLSVIALLVLVSLSLIVIILKQKQLLHTKEELDEFRKNNDELRIAMEELRDMAEAENSNKERAEHLWESYIDMYRKQNASIGRLFGKDVSKSVLPGHLETMVQEILDEVSGSGAESEAFERRLNQDLDNIMQKYRQDFPQQMPNQYRFAALVFAGFKDPDIGSILGLNTSAISSRKTRLKKQLLEKDSPNKDLYSILFK